MKGGPYYSFRKISKQFLTLSNKKLGTDARKDQAGVPSYFLSLLIVA